MYILFIDLKAAFDSVIHEKLFEKMRQKGVSEQVINSVKLTYSSIYTQVGRDSAAIPINRGVLQGGILSPGLFNIYIDDLLQGLREDRHHTICAYADDIAIICSNKHSLRRAVNRCQRWGEENGIPINYMKSGIMKIKKKAHASKQQLVEFGIPLVSHYKYLGVRISESLRLE